MTDRPARRGERRLGWRPFAYETDIAGETISVELPFVVGVFADLSGAPEEPLPPMAERKFLQLDVDNLEALMARVAPRLLLRVPNLLLDDDSQLAVELRFAGPEDFRPERVAQQVRPLHELLQARTELAPLAVRLEVRPRLADALAALLSDESVAGALGRLDRLDDEEADAGARERAALEAELAARLGADLWAGADAMRVAWAVQRGLAPGSVPRAGELRAAVDEMIARIDERIAGQLDLILHHQDFQRLEATWLGLAWLVRQTESGSLLKVRVFNASKKEMARDLAKAVEFDQSVLFKRLYSDEAYILGGEPFGLVLCDFGVSHHPADVKLLEHLGNIGASISAPVLVAADPALFGLDGWQELPRPRDLAKIFETVEYTRWRALREQADAAYLMLVLPRLLARRPWDTREQVAAHGFAYVEDASSPERLAWMSGVFGVAAVITNAFARDRWCADLRGPRWGRIDGLPAHYVVENEEVIEVTGPTEVDISDARHVELQRLGLTSLARHRRGEYAALLTPTALAKAAVFDTTDATEAARMRVQLEHILCLGRVSQTVRAFLREHSGTWDDRERLEQALLDWLGRYTVSAAEGEGEGGGEGAADDVLLAPFRSVQVRRSEAQSFGVEEERAAIAVELELNYLPKGAAVARVVVVFPPPGVLSSRLVP